MPTRALRIKNALEKVDSEVNRVGHHNAVDKIKVESRLFDYPLVLVCVDDGNWSSIEIYVVDDSGLEVYFSRLDKIDRRGSGNQVKFDVLLAAIKRRVREKPVSIQSLTWLSALKWVGLLR